MSCGLFVFQIPFPASATGDRPFSRPFNDLSGCCNEALKSLEGLRFCRWPPVLPRSLPSYWSASRAEGSEMTPARWALVDMLWDCLPLQSNSEIPLIFSKWTLSLEKQEVNQTIILPMCPNSQTFSNRQTPPNLKRHCKPSWRTLPGSCLRNKPNIPDSGASHKPLSPPTPSILTKNPRGVNNPPSSQQLLATTKAALIKPIHQYCLRRTSPSHAANYITPRAQNNIHSKKVLNLLKQNTF